VIISQIGNYSLIFGLILSFFLIIYLFLNFYGFIKINLNNIYSILFLQLFFVFVSFFGLVYSFVISDFSNSTVYNNSHTTKPLFYKISGTWGNHEGSMLLWLLVLTLFIFLFFIYSKKQPKNYRLTTLVFQEIIITGFFLFVLLTSNPFNHIFPIPIEGLGLNPILQDPALAIHPPILYLGYVGSSIIFSASLAALVSKNINIYWAQHIKKWIFLTWILLTFGILLGSIWAYYELGWGGFWFWDPVENVSLMPWFTLTALLHSISVLEKRSILKSWTIILSIATFSLSMSGTFLVRSGILNSVHTFANDPGRGVFILIFLFFLILISIIIFFFFQTDERTSTNKIYWMSKETSILINNWFMTFFLSVVLIGTTYPILLEVLTNEKISVGPPFYQNLLIPFLIPFLFFMAVGPNLKWFKSDYKKINFNKIFLLFFICFVMFFLVKKLDVKNLFVIILIISSLYLFTSSFIDLIFKRKNFSQNIAHFGFSVLILSIIFNGILSKEISANIKIGDEINFDGNLIKFKKIDVADKENYKSIIANFEIKDQKNKIILLKPEIRIYNQPNILTSEADIKSNLYEDKFIVFSILNREEIFNVRYQVKRFMIWIWISTFLIIFGGLIRLIKIK
tara:strand:+ start:727 stop:2601 length:1875 start_codon:yes stop_codon:yes gene_type:complete